VETEMKICSLFSPHLFSTRLCDGGVIEASKLYGVCLGGRLQFPISLHTPSS